MQKPPPQLAVLPQLAATYFSFDTRSLAAFRIALGLTLAADLWLRAPLRVAPTPRLLWAPTQQPPFSVFLGTWLQHGHAWLTAACAVAFVLLSVGFCTKWAQWLSLIAVVSLNARLAPLAAADVLLADLCIWSLFLPLGERFSFDSVRASLRRREQRAPDELNDRQPIRTPARRVYSLACLGLLVQLVAIYAVHYALHSGQAVKLPEYLPVAASACIALAIANPFGARYSRLLAILLLPVMHVGLDSHSDQSVCSYAMLAFYPLLLLPEHWDALRKRTQRWHKRRVVFVDDDCGFCMLCARLLARLDVLERLEFASNADQERLPRSISLSQADESITTLEPESGRVLRGAAAFAALIRSLPFGFLVAIPLALPGLRDLSEWAYRHVASRRLLISVWLGYGMCGLPQAPGATLAPDAEASEAGLFFTRILVLAREACVLAYAISAGCQLSG